LIKLLAVDNFIIAQFNQKLNLKLNKKLAKLTLKNLNFYWTLLTFLKGFLDSLNSGRGIADAIINQSIYLGSSPKRVGELLK